MFNEDEIIICTWEVNLLELDEGTIHYDGALKMYLAVDGSGCTDREFHKDPYYKIGNGTSYKNSDKITRIKLFSSEYDIHNNQRWELNGSDRKNLVKILNSHASKKYPDKTVWDLIKDEIIKESEPYGITEKDIQRIRAAEIPDYKSGIKMPKK